MFGNNPIRSVTTDPSHLAVETMFYTIQGEGPYSGMPALFIRLAGCNLACHFCDTQFETQAERLQPIGQIVRQVVETTTPQQRRFVVLTGGEPLRQNCVEFIHDLLANGVELVQIETAGTTWQEGLAQLIEEGRVVIVCSPKTPNVNIYIKEFCHHWKYIITAGEQCVSDLLPLRGTQNATKEKEQRLYRVSNDKYHWVKRPQDTVWVSPCDSYDPVKNKANQEAAVEASLKMGYRLSLQVHKIIGVE